MGLDDLVRSTVALASSITRDLQVDVTYEAFDSANATNQPTYDSAVTKRAVVEKKARMVRTTTGEEKLSQASVTFLVPFALDLRDRITLPDGTTAPILNVKGVYDPVTDEPYALEVFL